MRPHGFSQTAGFPALTGFIATAVGVSLAGYYPTGNARTAVDASAHVAGAPIPVTLICGDLTFQYDISALNLPMTELLPDLDVVVYDDAGGGIFTALEHGALAQNPQFARAVERFSRFRRHRIRIWNAWRQASVRSQVFGCAFTARTIFSIPRLRLRLTPSKIRRIKPPHRDAP